MEFVKPFVRKIGSAEMDLGTKMMVQTARLVAMEH